MNYASYHDLLNQELEKRKQLNPAYSLRAFARYLGFSAPRLSQVMSKKIGLSQESARLIVKRLHLDDNEASWFCDSVGALHSRKPKLKSEFQEKIGLYKQNRPAPLQLEYFKVISDWYHYAILELT